MVVVYVSVRCGYLHGGGVCDDNLHMTCLLPMLESQVGGLFVMMKRGAMMMTCT